jgi:DNA-binding LacI/PurR family transcriptional regulator
MKKFIYKGITVISTDFRMLGRKAAEFVANDAPMRVCVPTTIHIRESL